MTTNIRGLGAEKSFGKCQESNLGKAGPNQEGPYRITSVAGVGAYYLKDLDERAIPHPWNVNNLRMYYQ